MYKTPKKLKKINILGKDIVITIDDAICQSQGAMGLFTTGVIVLLSEYSSKADFVDTFSHECFHALNYVLGSQLDVHLEEIIANTMGQMNVQIIDKLLAAKVFEED